MKEVLTSKEEKTLVSKPPVVVVLGHIDHGKSSLLEKIKNLKITEKEAGGITQHLGAYEVEHQGKKITFIDTPGHEAFLTMRARGAQVADIALIVVDSSEGVKEQTKESIKIAKEAKVFPIVVLNKIDLPTSAPEIVKGQLQKAGLNLEDFGGEVPVVKVSAKTGEGIKDLLDIILLVAEMKNLKTDISKPAKGFVLESYLDPKKGPLATIILEEGSLEVGKIIATSTAVAKIRKLTDFLGNSLEGKVYPSTPALVLGFKSVPQVGERFQEFASLSEAEEFVKEEKDLSLEIEKGKVEQKELPVLKLIIKADTIGTLEAVEAIVNSLPQDKVKIEIIGKGIGPLTKNELDLAKEAKAEVVCFRVRPERSIKSLVEREFKVYTFDVIYHLTEKIKELMLDKLPKETVREDVGELKILKTFVKKKNRQIVGGRVLKGYFERGLKVEVLRKDEIVGLGKILNIQRNRREIKVGKEGDEIGILYEGTGNIEEGDLLIAFREIQKKPQVQL